MKKHILLTLCALIALVSNTFAQIQNGDTITISSNSYYLAVNTSNNGIAAVSMSAPTKACLWVVTVTNNNQYSFKSVAASEAGKNAGLYRNNNSLTLAATPTAFKFSTNYYETSANQTIGRLYFEYVSSNWWGSSTSYKFIHYTAKQNQPGTWGISSQKNSIRQPAVPSV